MESSVQGRRGSPRIFVTLAVAAAAAVLTTAVAFSLHPAPTGDAADATGAVAPVSGNAQPAEPAHDPSLPSPAKVFEHPPVQDESAPPTF